MVPVRQGRVVVVAEQRASAAPAGMDPALPVRQVQADLPEAWILQEGRVAPEVLRRTRMVPMVLALEGAAAVLELDPAVTEDSAETAG